ncbi:hypothetical protein MSG28_014141 [Choristoneura fumiferana]|uniref:Uncharacterized protein n=1 Tax=Choristoneura fumiferana TaxID=7141 RepID=A0ACC0JG42_CHOFU|nr:hypothetical protein MSG28_014141 [Choristoneura fumiferana]
MQVEVANSGNRRATSLEEQVTMWLSALRKTLVTIKRLILAMLAEALTIKDRVTRRKVSFTVGSEVATPASSQPSNSGRLVPMMIQRRPTYFDRGGIRIVIQSMSLGMDSPRRPPSTSSEPTQDSCARVGGAGSGLPGPRSIGSTGDVQPIDMPIKKSLDFSRSDHMDIALSMLMSSSESEQSDNSFMLDNNVWINAK